jgi:hypothetical protein
MDSGLFIGPRNQRHAGMKNEISLDQIRDAEVEASVHEPPRGTAARHRHFLALNGHGAETTVPKERAGP